MGLVLIAAFVAVPIGEIALLIEAGDRFGLWPTVGAVIFTAVLGAALVRHQGFSTLGRAQASLNAGRFPLVEVFDGFCILAAGALLLTPGFVTDGVGFLLLVPAARHLLREALSRHLRAAGRVTVWTDETDRDGRPRSPEGHVVIDGEYEEVRHARREPQRGADHKRTPWRKPDGE